MGSGQTTAIEQAIDQPRPRQLSLNDLQRRSYAIDQALRPWSQALIPWENAHEIQIEWNLALQGEDHCGGD
jgi:hypothetical protein